ncbi:MAG: galactokinase [Phycisphaerales bacterium]|nr:galactokinase [Phycisphaerales bacterium]
MSLTASPKLESVADQAGRAFISRFGRSPRWVVAAPGRLNLIGEHTDYNGGHVLPMAIERWCTIAADSSDAGRSTIFSLAQDEALHLDFTRPIEPAGGGWSNYVRGTARQFQDLGVALPNIAAIIASTVPVGSGLSSSAALCVSLATLLEQVSGQNLEPRDKALLCQRVEHEFAGVPCGIMDQSASIMARADHALHLDCRSGAIEHVPMPPRDRAVMLVIDTGVHHDLATNEYGQRRRQCEQAVTAIARLTGRPINSLRDVDAPMLASCAARLDPLIRRRAQHVITENERVLKAVAALRAGQLDAFGELMFESHDSLRDEYEVSCAELDCVVAAARQLGAAGGVMGARMTGGGFGGCAIVLCAPQSAEQVARSIGDSFNARFARLPAIFATAAADGAAAVHLRGN